MDVGIRADLRKQAGRGVQAGDLEACAVQRDLFAGGDVQPRIFAEVDIGRQNAGNVRVLALCNEPRQLRAGADLINALVVRLRLGLRSAVPCIRRDRLQRDGEFVGACLRHGDAAGGIFHASAGNGIEVFLGIGLERAVLRDHNGIARAVRQRDGQVLAVNGRAVLILEHQLAAEERGRFDRNRNLRQTAENARRLGRVEAGVCALGIRYAAMCRQARKATLLDRAGQRIICFRPILRDRNMDLLALRIAAEIINAEVAAGISLKAGAIRTLKVCRKVEVVYARELLLRADKVGKLDRDRIARLDGSQLFLRQLRALRVDKLVAHAACRHDLIGGEAVLRDFDDMPSGSQAADRYRAVLSGRNAGGREAARKRHCRRRNAGTQHRHLTTFLGLEAVACALGAGVEENVMLRIELKLLAAGNIRIHAIQHHVRLNGAAVGADRHDEHARQFRPDGREAMRVRAGLTVHMRHSIIGHEHDCCARMLRLHDRNIAVQRIRRDADDVAGIALFVDHLIVHLRQRDLGVHKAFDREPVAEGVEFKRLANGHVFIALGVDVEINARAVVDIVLKMVNGALAEIAGQAEILFRDRIRRIGAQSDVVPVGRTLRMTDTVEIIRVLVQMERGRAVLDGTLNRLKEAEHKVLCERTGIDGRALRRSDRDRDKFLAGQADAVIHCRGLGCGSCVEVRVCLRVRCSRHGDRIANDKQAARGGLAPVGRRACRGAALCAGGVGDYDAQRVILALYPCGRVDGDLIDALEREAARFRADVDRHAAVAFIVRVVSIDPVCTGRERERILAAFRLHAAQQILGALDAAFIGVQLQALDLRVVQAAQRNADTLAVLLRLRLLTGRLLRVRRFAVRLFGRFVRRHFHRLDNFRLRRLCGLRLCRPCAERQNAEHHDDGQEQTQNSFLHLILLQ